MKKIRVKTSKEYDVLIGLGLLDRAGELIAGINDDAGKHISNADVKKKAAIVTDSNVADLYGDMLTSSLDEAGFDTATIAFAAGEENKTGNTLLNILGSLAESGLTRDDIVIALGGGVAGDLAGLAAALYMRGIEYVQIPTSILAAVDSSIGGKTAIDLPQGKNLAGVFHQPSLVIIDTTVFDTLPEGDYRSGFAEIIKYGMIEDPQILDGVIAGGGGRIPHRVLEGLISRCIEIKKSIVEEDEFDRGKRHLLNFGHTLGHAIEKATGYSIRHGEAVAIGMVMMTEAAVRSGVCDEGSLIKLKQAIRALTLEITGNEYDRSELFKYIETDKKNTPEGINVVIPKRAGNCTIEKMTMRRLAEFL